MRTHLTRSLLLISLLFWGSGCGTKPQASLPLSFWDWQSQTVLKRGTRDLLQAHGIPFLFVKAGAIVQRGETWGLERKLTEPVFKSYGTFPLHLCYRVSSEAIGGFEKQDPIVLGRFLAERLTSDVQEATEAGAVIQGVQLDFDCPTRLLPRYADLLSELCLQLRKGTTVQISITAMETWLRHFIFRKVIKPVDFYVPIFYGNDIPDARKDLTPLVSKRRLEWELRWCGWLGKPFWVGLPVYSFGILYDGQGHKLSPENDIFLDDLAQSRNLGYAGSTQRKHSFEMEHRFHVNEAAFWRGWPLAKGWDLVVEESTPAEFRDLWKTIQERRNTWMKGAVCFYLDKEGRGGCLLPEAVLAMNNAAPPSHSIALRARIEAEKAGRLWLSASLTNLDPFPSLLGSDPVLLQIRIRDGQFESVEPGDFQALEYGMGFQSKTTRSSMARATQACLRSLRVPALGRLETGKVQIVRTGPHFAVYLYGWMDSSLLFKKIVCADYEVYPEPVTARSLTQDLSR